MEGTALGNLGIVCQGLGNTPAAIAHYHQALVIHREVGNRRLEGFVLGDLGVIFMEQGNYPAAIAHYHQALAIHREVGNKRSEGTTLGNLGVVYQEQGSYPAALAHYQQALAIHREVGNKRSEGVVFGWLANVHKEQGNYPEAIALFQQALVIHREVGNKRTEGGDLGNLGDALLRQGRLEDAAHHLEAAISIGEETWPLAAGAFRASLALVHAQQGNIEAALSLLSAGERTLVDYPLEFGKFLCKKAHVCLLAGEREQADAALQQAQDIAKELNAKPDSELGTSIQELVTLLQSLAQSTATVPEGGFGGAL